MKETIQLKFKADDDTKKAFTSVRRNIKQTGDDMTKFGKAMRVGFAGLAGVAGVGVAKSFIEAADVSEQYRVRLNALLGDVEEGGRLFETMTDFASRVPFEYREIMASATQLAGVLKGGVDEINEWMPLIGDLAAVSGLSIQATTEQVSRMLSAGAASADMFRERGILSMLGFQAGVKYSAEETREILKSSWEKSDSQFNGATDDLANTWSGLMSMMADQWFKFKNDVLDEDSFGSLKSGLRELIEMAASFREDGIFGAVFGSTDYIKQLEREYESLSAKIKIDQNIMKVSAGSASAMLAERRQNELRLQRVNIELKLKAIRKDEADLKDVTDFEAQITRTAELVKAERVEYLAWLEEVKAKEEAKAIKAAAKEAAKYKRELTGLLDKLDPVGAKARDYVAASEMLHAEMLKGNEEVLPRYQELMEELANQFSDSVVEVDAANGSFEDFADTGKDAMSDLQSAVDGWHRDFADKMLAGEFSIKSFAKTMIDELARITLSKATQPFFDMFGDMVGGLFSSNTVGSMIAEQTGFGGGAAGVLSGAEFNSFAVGTNYVPKDQLAYIHEGEAIVPKEYNPAAGGSGGGGNVNVTINVDASGNESESGGGSQGAELARQIKGAVLSVIADERRPGGIMAGAA